MRGASNARRIVKCQRGDWTDTPTARPLTTMQKTPRALQRPSTKYSQTDPPPARTNFRSQKTPTRLFSVRRVSTFLGRNPQRCAVSNLSGGNFFQADTLHARLPFQIIKLIFPSSFIVRVFHKAALPHRFSSSLCAHETQERLGDARQVHCSRGGKQIVIALAINKLFNCARCVHKSISAVRRN